jgi:predicted dehydrogenase
MSKIHVGLIGFGAWSRSSYLPALQQDGRAVIAAVSAASENSRKCAQEILGQSITVYKDYHRLLEQSDLDAVMIAVPEKLHQAALSAAIDSGIPIFYEPPIADTREQIPIMIDKLLAARQVTHADLELGFHPAIERAIALIKDSQIGLLQNVTVTLQANWGIEHADSDLCLINRMTCWYVDILNRIVGSLPKRVLVLDGYGNPGRRQTNGTSIYDYDGVWGFLKANVDSAEKLSLSVDVGGDHGDILIDFFTGVLHHRNHAFPDWIEEFCVPLKPLADWPGVRESVSSFFDSVISGKPSPCNAGNVTQFHRIGLAAEESKDTGHWAEIPLSSTIFPDGIK